MSGLREPDLGPIVGHTTSTSSRIWIRACDPGDDAHELTSHRRTVGVIAVLEERGQVAQNPRLSYFRLHREFDRTGSFELGKDCSIGTEGNPTAPLLPDADYCVGLGTLSVDDAFHDDDNVPDEDLFAHLPPLAPWMVDELRGMSDQTKARFRTFPAASQDKLAFVLGSCRYPGILWQAKRADKVFGPMVDLATDRTTDPPVRFALMVGDQIYADEFNRHLPIGRADSFGEFQERYHTAFGSMNMRRLLRSLPTYMILDDHEIEDNWTQDRLHDHGKHVLFNLAITAYMSYQWSHGPRTWGRHFHYTFDCGGYPFFVLDTRTQRYKDDVGNTLDDDHMLGRPALDPTEPSQIDRFLGWLREQQKSRGDLPKFVVTSSVFVPNFVCERQGPNKKPDQKRLEQSDAWPAYPETRRAILDAIVEDKIQNVIFLSGDVHCSNVAELYFQKGGKKLPIKSFAITSSAFFWPFPFADGNPAEFVHDSTAKGQEDTFAMSKGVTMDYRAWNFTQTDNYCHVSVDKAGKKIDVRVCDADGNLTALGSGNPSVLNLFPW